MANIARRPDGRWRARYRDRAGKEISQHFRAEDRCAAVARRSHDCDVNGTLRRSGEVADHVDEWSQRWLNSKTNLKPTTRRDYESQLHAHIRPRWGKYALAEIEHEDIVSWLADLTASGLSASRVRALHVALSQMLSSPCVGTAVAQPGRVRTAPPRATEPRSAT